MTGRECEIKLTLSADGVARLHRHLGPAARVILQRNHYLDTPAGDLRRLKHGLRLRLEIALPPAALDPPEDAVQRIILPLPRWEESPGAFPRVPWPQPQGTLVEAPPSRLPETPSEAPPSRPFGDADRYVLSLKGPATRLGDWLDRLDEQAEISHVSAGDILMGGAEARELPLSSLARLAAELALERVRVLGAADNLRRIYAVDLDPGHGNCGPRPLSSLRLEVDSTRYPDGTIEHEAELELPHELRLSGAEMVRAALQSMFARVDVPWTPSTRGKFSRFLERAGLAS